MGETATAATAATTLLRIGGSRNGGYRQRHRRPHRQQSSLFHERLHE
jgi:hypothetical protein